MRVYHFLAEVSNVPDNKEKAVSTIIFSWVDDFKDYTYKDHVASCQSTTKLGGGQQTKEAHEEFKKEILKVAPEAKVKTFWAQAAFNWEDTYGDDENEEAN